MDKNDIDDLRRFLKWLAVIVIGFGIGYLIFYIFENPILDIRDKIIQ